MRVRMSAATDAASHGLAARELLVGDRPTQRSVKEQFFGTWKLLSWKIEEANGDGTRSSWVDHVPAGRIHVGALMRPDRPKFASDNLVEATPEEVEAAFGGYISYFGSYEVHERERFVIHRLQLSWFPNLVGTEQKRFFEFAGDRLMLKTPPLTLLGETQVHRLIWQRLM